MVRRHPRHERPGAHFGEPVTPQEPERARGIAHERSFRIVAAGARGRDDLTVAQPQQQPGGVEQPERAVRVGFDGADLSAGPARRKRRRTPLAAVAARQVARFLAGPQRPGGIFEEARHAPGFQAARLRRVKHDKAQAVESRQAIECPDPEIPVARLDQRSHRILRQPILGLPAADQPITRPGRRRGPRREEEQAERGEETAQAEMGAGERHAKQLAPDRQHEASSDEKARGVEEKKRF